MFKNNISEGTKGIDVQSILVDSYEAGVQILIQRPFSGVLFLFIAFFMWQLPCVALISHYFCRVRPNLSSLWHHEREA